MKAIVPFFLFLLILVGAGIGFGFYAKDIDCRTVTSIAGLECYRLYLAFGVLFTVAVLMAMAAAFYVLVPPPAAGGHPGQSVFDTFAKSLVPVVTLVLGFYFGSNGQTAVSKDKPADQTPGVAPQSTASGAASQAKGK
ncbi:hypothetical protein [Pelomonas cellulosilytica]|uniref:Uncharacterized protein n=1 Tax=Pelomonas cellulosilytica TaxID=2906762 RepID=A0ABS8XQQ3_9BURK|nr:hypothetical protein [Pelomonas sp. P8]MCE4553987.1 hypothetical protein [Pelomonas sp. P8]